MDVLIVDDDQTNLDLFSHMVMLIDGAEPLTANDPRKALDWCASHVPDLVLVDYMMPGMDGLEFLQRFRALPGMDLIPVIMITADTHTTVRHAALRGSANDFLTKPVNAIELKARAGNLLALRRAQQQLAVRADWLATEVQRATAAVAASEREAILRLSRTAEYRDPETGAHLLRMAAYAGLIAEQLCLSPFECQLIRDAAPMHDIGKVAIPDAILLKPGKLSDEEMAVMRTHAQIGADILAGSESPLLQAAATIAASHHEKYDGSGYPKGLRGDQIPLYGRIIAVADVFDALTSTRPYKTAWTMEAAADWLRQQAGRHFDPDCVAALLGQQEAIRAIQDSHQDPQLQSDQELSPQARSFA